MGADSARTGQAGVWEASEGIREEQKGEGSWGRAGWGRLGGHVVQTLYVTLRQ